MTEVTKKEFALGALWKIIEQFSSKGISLVVSIILARLLLPQDFGVLALTVVFTNFSDILIDGGFSTTLIRKEYVSEDDYNSVFVFSLIIASFLYLILFFIAPHLATYYEQPLLINVLRVVGLTFFMQAFSAVRIAEVCRKMNFKLLFHCNILGSILSAIFGISLAYLGYGVWAMVFQRLFQQLLVTLLLFIKVRLKLRFKFIITNLKVMYRFSLGVLGSSFLNYIGGSLYNLVVGKRYSVIDLGYYDKGSQLPMQASLYTFGAMSSVLLPTISPYQNDLVRMKVIIRKVVTMSGFLIYPMMIGIALVAKELTIVLFTEKWLPIVKIMQYSCIYYIATPFMLINVQVFFALGRSSLRVKSEIIRLILMILGLLIFSMGLNVSLNTLALVSAVIAVISSLITLQEVSKLLSYSWYEILADHIKPLSISILMGVSIIYFERNNLFGINPSALFGLLSKFAFGVFVYIFLAFVFKVDGLNEVANLIRRKIA